MKSKKKTRSPAKDRTEFSEWLRAQRLEHGFKQSDCADLTGISAQMWCHYETSHRIPSVQNLALIGKLFDVGMDDALTLLGRNEAAERRIAEFKAR